MSNYFFDSLFLSFYIKYLFLLLKETVNKSFTILQQLYEDKVFF